MILILCAYNYINLNVSFIVMMGTSEGGQGIETHTEMIIVEIGRGMARDPDMVLTDLALLSVLSITVVETVTVAGITIVTTAVITIPDQVVTVQVDDDTNIGDTGTDEVTDIGEGHLMVHLVRWVVPFDGCFMLTRFVPYIVRQYPVILSLCSLLGFQVSAVGDNVRKESEV